MSGAGVSAVVPVKDLQGTKSRLAPILDPGARAGLTLYMMGRVVAAIRSAGVEDVCVVSPDRIVLKRRKDAAQRRSSRRAAGSTPPSKKDAAGRSNSEPLRCSYSPQTCRSSMRMMCGPCYRRRVKGLRWLSPLTGRAPVRTRS